jgi:starch-binding outer membrane protein, SusD/RagB family
MKKALYILGIFLLALAGCEVMNVESEDAIPASKAFKNKAGIEKGILGSYSELQYLSYYGRAYLIASDLAADNLAHPADATNSDYAEIDNNAILAENSAVSGIWAVIYEGINVANNVIVKVPEMGDMTIDEKKKALGELYFLRALNHFNLLNYFGPIPIKIEPTVGTGNLNAGRDPVEMVYNQIISDLIQADELLSASASVKIRASKYAAIALLARVYLYRGDYDMAEEKADSVIKYGGYTLLENYGDIFASDGSAESIFEVDFSEVDRNRIAEYNFPKSLNGRREVAPDERLISAYEPNDERKAVSIAYDGNNAYANKYNDLSKGADNVIILRLAEMYLIRAEAEARKSGGSISFVQDDINTIRARAGLDSTNAGTIDELLLAIEKERRVEFAFEGHRWFDLVRTGRAMEVLPTVTSINQTLFPIPADEILTNDSPDMYQNTGY